MSVLYCYLGESYNSHTSDLSTPELDIALRAALRAILLHHCLMLILHIPSAAEARPHIQNNDLEQRVQTRARTPESPLTGRAGSREQCAPGEPRFMCTGRTEGGRIDDCCDANKPLPSFALCYCLGASTGEQWPSQCPFVDEVDEVYTKDMSPSFRFINLLRIRQVSPSRSLHHTRSLALPSSNHVRPRPPVSLHA